MRLRPVELVVALLLALLLALIALEVVDVVIRAVQIGLMLRGRA